MYLEIRNSQAKIEFDESTLVGFKHGKLEIFFTPRFIYKLLFEKDQATFDLLTKSINDNLISKGK
jgi:hypothetical protein